MPRLRAVRQAQRARRQGLPVGPVHTQDPSNKEGEGTMANITRKSQEQSQGGRWDRIAA